MKTSVKRFFSLICAICMMISNVPVTVIAEMITAEERAEIIESTSDVFDTDTFAQANESPDEPSDTENTTTYVDMLVGEAMEISLDDVVRLTVNKTGQICVSVDGNVELTSRRNEQMEHFLPTNGKLAAKLSVNPGVYELTFASVAGSHGSITVDIRDEEQHLASQASDVAKGTVDAEQTETEPDAEVSNSAKGNLEEENAEEVGNDGETDAEQGATENTETAVDLELQKQTELAEASAESGEEANTNTEARPEAENARVVSDAENLTNITDTESNNEEAITSENTQEESVQRAEETVRGADIGEQVSDEKSQTEETTPELENVILAGENAGAFSENEHGSIASHRTEAMGEEKQLTITETVLDEDENHIVEETASNDTANALESASEDLSADENVVSGEEEKQETEFVIEQSETISGEKTDINELTDPSVQDEQTNETTIGEDDTDESVFDEIGGVEGNSDAKQDEEDESANAVLIKISGESDEASENGMQDTDESIEEKDAEGNEETEDVEKNVETEYVETESGLTETEDASAETADAENEDDSEKEIPEAGDKSDLTEDAVDASDSNENAEQTEDPAEEVEENQAVWLSSDDIAVEQLSEDTLNELVEKLRSESTNAAENSARGPRRASRKATPTSDTVTSRTGYVAFDIDLINEELMKAGNYVVPVALNVPVSLREEGETIENISYMLYHFSDDGIETANVIDFTVEDGRLLSFVFETDGFSSYVLEYTVDFHYNGVDYSIPGESQILLSDLIEKLQIKNGEGLLNVADVASASFTDGRLLSVQQVSGLITYNDVENVDVGEKDFLLTSLEPFTTSETLKIILTNGSSFIVGVVTLTEDDISVAKLSQDETEALTKLLGTDENSGDKESDVDTSFFYGILAYDISLNNDSLANADSYIVSLTLETPVNLQEECGDDVQDIEYVIYHIHSDNEGNQSITEIQPLSVHEENGILYGLDFETDGFSSFAITYKVYSNSDKSNLFTVTPGSTYTILIYYPQVRSHRMEMITSIMTIFKKPRSEV